MFIQLTDKIINTEYICEIEKCHDMLFTIKYTNGKIRYIDGKDYMILSNAIFNDK